MAHPVGNGPAVGLRPFFDDLVDMTIVYSDDNLFHFRTSTAAKHSSEAACFTLRSAIFLLRTRYFSDAKRGQKIARAPELHSKNSVVPLPLCCRMAAKQNRATACAIEEHSKNSGFPN
jgi:hypothetical protein